MPFLSSYNSAGRGVNIISKYFLAMKSPGGYWLSMGKNCELPVGLVRGGFAFANHRGSV